MKLTWIGGGRGTRTPDTAFQPYNGLVNRSLLPLGTLHYRLYSFIKRAAH